MAKNNFDLFIALLPEETMKMMQTYDNKGNIYLKTSIKGKSINGHNPAVKLRAYQVTENSTSN